MTTDAPADAAHASTASRSLPEPVGSPPAPERTAANFTAARPEPASLPAPAWHTARPATREPVADEDGLPDPLLAHREDLARHVEAVEDRVGQLAAGRERLGLAVGRETGEDLGALGRLRPRRHLLRHHRREARRPVAESLVEADVPRAPCEREETAEGDRRPLEEPERLLDERVRERRAPAGPGRSRADRRGRRSPSASRSSSRRATPSSRTANAASGSAPSGTARAGRRRRRRADRGGEGTCPKARR